MALQPLTREEFAAELEMRRAKRVGDAPNGYTLWETESGEPFSVPPPEEVVASESRYPEWFLDDLIREVGLPPKSVAN